MFLTNKIHKAKQRSRKPLGFSTYSCSTSPSAIETVTLVAMVQKPSHFEGLKSKNDFKEVKIETPTWVYIHNYTPYHWERLMHDLYCTVYVWAFVIMPFVSHRFDMNWISIVQTLHNVVFKTETIYTSSTLLPAKYKWCHWKSYLKTSSTAGFHHHAVHGQTCSRTSSVVDGGQKLPNRPTWRPGPTVSLLDWAKQQWNRWVEKISDS